MCTVSMIGDHYRDTFPQKFPTIFPLGQLTPQINPTIVVQGVKQEDFDALKKDVLEMKELLKRAVKYDQEHDQPDCQMEEKLSLLRQVAALVGVNLEDALKPCS